MSDLSIQINEGLTLPISSDMLEVIDILHLGKHQYHLRLGNKNWQIEVLEFHSAEKRCVLKVNGQKVTTLLKDDYDALIEKLGLSKNVEVKISDIKAPMPGLVIDVPVAVGDTIEKGDILVILEAMKMENVIKSPADGVISAVHVAKGQAVDKNAIMVSL